MPKTLTMAQAMRATGLSRHTLKRIAEENDVCAVLEGRIYKKYLFDPARLSQVVPITPKDVEKAVKG